MPELSGRFLTPRNIDVMFFDPEDFKNFKEAIKLPDHGRVMTVSNEDSEVNDKYTSNLMPGWSLVRQVYTVEDVQWIFDYSDFKFHVDVLLTPGRKVRYGMIDGYPNAFEEMEAALMACAQAKERIAEYIGGELTGLMMQRVRKMLSDGFTLTGLETTLQPMDDMGTCPICTEEDMQLFRNRTCQQHEFCGKCTSRLFCQVEKQVTCPMCRKPWEALTHMDKWRLGTSLSEPMS
ncbi:hypothetical protein PLESTB_001029700 [Pleodorina starrii]|uniref:RING-type domain-containing protein n=1 Tax=Pleodorina starrii TaxID=330485 RepID=A0A9W6BP10_9CHLO|nr:hypothetical protein PLESTM_001812400 [Pleodorina starrii]GLC55796.1 hypothetical protein PLESTB_001029700 [Pleodorina starrii]GLC68872.1 hypothetical protein PLESTF_000747500 [Pleodorina starrii]